MIVGLRIMKKVQEAYGKDDNKHLKEKINVLLVDLKIIKRVREASNGDSNGHLREEMNLFINKK